MAMLEIGQIVQIADVMWISSMLVRCHHVPYSVTSMAGTSLGITTFTHLMEPLVRI